MADIVASSVVQEGVSRVSSYISAKLDEKASRGQIMARLEWALFRLGFALERTAEYPNAFFYPSLIRQRMTLKKVHKEGTDLLEKLKLQPVEGGEEEIHQWVTGSSFLRWISRARNLPILSLVGLSKEDINSSVVQKFESYADWAKSFVSDVESGWPVRHPAFCCSLERQLLEGKTLVYEIVQGSQEHYISMLPVFYEGRGIEVDLRYSYMDFKTPEKNFFLVVTLRLSQGTRIAETAVQCMQFVTETLELSTSRFKRMMEHAMGKVARLSSPQDISHPYAPPFGPNQEFFVYLNRLCLPDSIHCDKDVLSSELSHRVPEPVVHIQFSCFTSVPEYMWHSSTDEVVGPNASIQSLNFYLLPHYSSEPATYSVDWTSPYDAAIISLRKSSSLTASLKQRTVARPHRRAAKRTKR